MCHVVRGGSNEARHSPDLHCLSRRVIDLKDSRLRNFREAIRASIETRAEQDHLCGAVTYPMLQEIVNEPCARDSGGTSARPLAIEDSDNQRAQRWYAGQEGQSVSRRSQKTLRVRVHEQPFGRRPARLERAKQRHDFSRLAPVFGHHAWSVTCHIVTAAVDGLRRFGPAFSSMSKC